jgi:hypothetical protein
LWIGNAVLAALLPQHDPVLASLLPQQHRSVVEEAERITREAARPERRYNDE